MNRLSCFAGLAGLALVAIVGGVAQAQTCDGYTPFSVAPVRATGDLTLVDQAQTYRASFAAGQAEPGWFGGLSIAGTRFDGAGETRRTSGLFGGFSVPLKAIPGTEICPVADFVHGWSASSADSLSIGVALGHTIAASSTVDIVPFGDLRYHDFRNAFYRGTLALGAGIVFSTTLTVRPAVLIPIAKETSSGAFRISLGYSFGGK